MERKNANFINENSSNLSKNEIQTSSYRNREIFADYSQDKSQSNTNNNHFSKNRNTQSKEVQYKKSLKSSQNNEFVHEELKKKALETIGDKISSPTFIPDVEINNMQNYFYQKNTNEKPKTSNYLKTDISTSQKEQSKKSADILIQKPTFDSKKEQPIETQSSPEKMINTNLQNQQNQEKTTITKLSDDKIESFKISLKKLFHFYSILSNRNSNERMKACQFLKFTVDSEITGIHFDHKNLDLIYTSINRNQSGITYDQFLKIIYIISQKFYNNDSANDNFRLFLEHNILPFYQTIYRETNIGFEDKIFSSNINMASLILIHIKKKIFMAIYTEFFTDEIRSEKIIMNEKLLLTKSKQTFVNFLRDFEILPHFISISLANSFFTHVLNIFNENQNIAIKDLFKTTGVEIGTIFTFNKFLFTLVKLSIYVFSDAKNVIGDFDSSSLTSDEKFYMLLEKMETSKGFQSFICGKEGKKFNSKLTLSSTDLSDLHEETQAFGNFKDRVESNELKSHFLFYTQKQNQKKVQKIEKTEKKLHLTEKITEKNNENDQISNFLAHFRQQPNFNETISLVIHEIEQIFKKYATVQDLSTGVLGINSFKFINFLKDSKIIFPEKDFSLENNKSKKMNLKINEADHIFLFLTQEKKMNTTLDYKKEKNLLKSDVKKLLNFDKFVFAIEILTSLFFSNFKPEKAFEEFYYQFIFPNFGKKNKRSRSGSIEKDGLNEKIHRENILNNNFKFLFYSLQEEKITEFLKNLNKAIFPIFKRYSDDSYFINFEKFMELFTDFEIFPEVVSLLKFREIFDTLNFMFVQNPEKKVQIENGVEVIDLHLFIESFLLIAKESDFGLEKDISLLQKVVFLIVLMSESDGFAKMLAKFPGFRHFDILMPIKQNHSDLLDI